MKAIAVFLVATYYIFAVSHAGPIETKTDDLFDEKYVIYTGQHEIVKIYTSLTLIEKVHQRIVFFLEADINSDGIKVHKGLYVIINNSTIKLLDNCKDIAGDATGKVFFATKEGIYIYNPKEHSANKYGHMEESIISLAAENNTGVIYALTEKHVLFKITENGTKVDVDDRVKHAREIKLDFFDNLYYYDEDKNLFIVVGENAKKINGLPKNSTSATMINLPREFRGIFLITDDVPYIVYSNGTSIKSETNYKRIKPTAYSFDAILILYFGHEKKIYEYNIIALIIKDMFEGIVKLMKEKLKSVTFP